MNTPTAATPLLIVCGWNDSGVAAATSALLSDHRNGTQVLVHHDLSVLDEGLIIERVCWPVGLGGSTERTIHLEHGCVSCTLRESVLPLLRRLGRHPRVGRIVLRLDSRLEPAAVCSALDWVLVPNPGDDIGSVVGGEDVEVQAVVTVVDVGTWWVDVSGAQTLAAVARAAAPEDERTVAQVVAGQTEFADVLVLTGSPAWPWDRIRLEAALARLSPSAVRCEIAEVARAVAGVSSTARRGAVDDPHSALLRGMPPLEPECGLALVEFAASRPFHPERLHEAVDVLLGGVLRSRGRIWLASQPDTVLWLESAGEALCIDRVGPWLAAMTDDDPAWADVPPERQAMASLRWGPVYGDRHSEIVVLVHDADPAHIRAVLEAALLTDVELAAGERAWRRWADPFGERHHDPCDDVIPAPPGISARTSAAEDGPA
ncbi:MAG: GTP-binding protein [Geodermatophilaceae bacterium]|nr:GTP-binding protein [Geodermatophilaceae bacterium]